MTIKAYYQVLYDFGAKPTGDATKLTEEWTTKAGDTFYVTRPSELSPQDRAYAMERLRRTLGIGGFPHFPRVH